MALPVQIFHWIARKWASVPDMSSYSQLLIRGLDQPWEVLGSSMKKCNRCFHIKKGYGRKKEIKLRKQKENIKITIKSILKDIEEIWRFLSVYKATSKIVKTWSFIFERKYWEKCFWIQRNVKNTKKENMKSKAANQSKILDNFKVLYDFEEK